MKWNYEDYMKWLDDGHIINENVVELNISQHEHAIQNVDYINNLPINKNHNLNVFYSYI